VGYGDDASAATNYPLVRVLASPKGVVFYCRTFGHSTMAVATAAALETTNFFVPFTVPTGTYRLTVIANGIASLPTSVSITGFTFNFHEPRLWQRLIGSLADGPLWAIGPHGPVPVDPWGPEYSASVREARQAIVAGIRSLQKIGLALDRERLASASRVPAEVDPALPAWARPRGSGTKARALAPAKAVSKPSRSNSSRQSLPKHKKSRTEKIEPALQSHAASSSALAGAKLNGSRRLDGYSHEAVGESANP
jgi:hypothetical protein